MVNYIQQIIEDIEEDNQRREQEFHDFALFCAEADYEHVPIELRTPYDPIAATQFKKARFSACLEQLRKGRFIVDLASIVINKVFIRKNKAITIVYENSMQDGLFEKALADIYCRKIKNGSIEF